MYSVTKIYIERQRIMQIYNTCDISIADMFKRVQLNTKMFLSVYNKEKEVFTAIDFCKLINDLDINSEWTWKEFDKFLTDKVVIGYETHLPGFIVGTENPSHPVKFWDAMGGIGTFEIGYGHHLSEERNIKAFRWGLTDVMISLMEGAESYPNLKNCIPVVNGLACRPYYFNDILYGINGSTYCYHGGDHFSQEVQLLDFNELGNMSISTISTLESGDDTKTIAKFSKDNNTLTFITKRSLHDNVPIIVLGGMIILPDRIHVHNEHSFSIDIDKTLLHKCFVYQNYLQANYLKDSDVVVGCDSVTTILKRHLNNEDSGDCFIAYIECKRIMVTRHKLTSWRSGISIDSKYSEGLLINDSVGCIVNFHIDRYTKTNELTVQHREPIFLVDRKESQDQKIFLGVDCHHIPMENLHDCSYSLALISGDRE